MGSGHLSFLRKCFDLSAGRASPAFAMALIGGLPSHIGYCRLALVCRPKTELSCVSACASRRAQEAPRNSKWAKTGRRQKAAML